MSELGEGSFGKIWIVRHNQTGGTHVLKEIALAGLSPNEVAATRLEVEVMKRLESPYIVAFVNSYEDQGVVGIMMEHAAGGDLQKEIDKRLANGGKEHFAEYHVRDYARQLASAVSYIHKTLMLLHRDLKPANVFLSERNGKTAQACATYTRTATTHRPPASSQLHLPRSSLLSIASAASSHSPHLITHHLAHARFLSAASLHCLPPHPLPSTSSASLHFLCPPPHCFASPQR